MYTHSPLIGSFSTRLILFEPAETPEAAIRCSLVETPLDSPLEYAALSYTWDAQSASYSIECGGGMLNVALNCWAVFRALRDKQELPKFWEPQKSEFFHSAT